MTGCALLGEDALLHGLPPPVPVYVGSLCLVPGVSDPLYQGYISQFQDTHDIKYTQTKLSISLFNIERLKKKRKKDGVCASVQYLR